MYLINGKKLERLDEHLGAWKLLWRDSPVSFRGGHYAFDDVWLEPKAFRTEGPRLWFGGQRLHDRLVRRLVDHGHGFNPLGRAGQDDLERLATAMAAAGRDMAELEMVGGTRGSFPDASHLAALDGALDQIPEQVERGFTTICIKPSQFTDDPAELPALLRRIVEGVETRVSG